MKGKRITAIILSGMLLATSVLPVFSTNSKAAEVKETSPIETNSAITQIAESKINVEDYYLDSKDFIVGDETGFYSWDLDGKEKINENSVIIYETEDGTQHEYKAIKREGSEKYSFLMKLDTVGVWKLVSINGQKANSDFLNITVHKDEIDLLAAESSKVVQAIKDEEASEIGTRSVSANNRVYRYAGLNRYDTAVKVSQAHYGDGRSSNVVITNGLNFPDALAAISLAKQLNAPVLFASVDTITNNTKAEIKRLGVRNAYIIGGTSAVNSSVESAVRSITGSVTRIYGANRMETAIEVAKKTMSYYKGDTAILVTGSDFPDAVSISPYSGKNAFPIFFAMGGTMDAATKNFINQNFSKVLIVGGTSAVSSTTESSLRSLGKTVNRIYGSNRYDTSEKIATTYFPSVERVYMATGADFADALSGGAMGARSNAAMILAAGDSVSTTTRNYLRNTSIHTAYIIGDGISVNYENSVRTALTVANIPTPMRDRIVAEALKYQGYPYAWGEEDPSRGFDCSGLVYYVYQKVAGITLPRTSAEQAKAGKYVAKSNLQLGDLMFFATNNNVGRVSHVGMYIGNGQMIHAPQPGETVTIVSINNSYWNNTYVTSRSYLN